MTNQPKALVLFAGGGGSTLGLEQAGYDTTSIEVDPAACDTLGFAGFNRHRVDLSTWYGRNRVRALGSDWDILWASPPCQIHSKANTRRKAGVDGWPWTAELVRDLRPRAVIIENVSGAPWDQWSSDLAALGYRVHRLDLDAADYGVPQHRHRTFLVALLGGRAWHPPAITHGPRAPDLPGWLTLGEALPWLRRARARGCTGVVVYPDHGGDRPEMLARPAPTVTCQEVKGTRASEASGWEYNGGPDRASDAAFSGASVRRLRPVDCAILQGFPKDYPWRGNITERYRQIGNAVPPVMAKVLGESVLP